MSEREKKLLVLVGVLFFVVIYYYLAYVPITKQVDAAEAEKSTLTAQLNVLNMDVIRKDEYLKGIETAKAEIVGAEMILPAALPQELVIKSLTDFEANVKDIKIPTFSMSPLETKVYSDNAVAVDPNTAQPVPATADTTSQTPTETTGAAVSVAPTERGIAVTVSTSISTTYDSFKLFLKYLQTYPIRVSVNGLSLTSNPVDGKLTATFTLTWFGLESSDRTISNESYFGDYNFKKNSIFEPFSKFSSSVTTPTTTTQEEKEDFFLILDPITSDGTTVIIGKTGDPQGTTYVHADKNGVENIEMEFYQVGSSYYYRYKTSNESYPSNYSTGIAFTPGKSIDIQLISSKRNSAEDLSGANATIINKTDIQVNVKKFTEDLAKPRLTINKTEGQVNAN